MVSSTHTNMLRTLGQALGMDDSPTPAAITGAVRHILQQRDTTYATYTSSCTPVQQTMCGKALRTTRCCLHRRAAVGDAALLSTTLEFD